jgi:hypothetical protein
VVHEEKEGKQKRRAARKGFKTQVVQCGNDLRSLQEEQTPKQSNIGWVQAGRKQKQIGRESETPHRQRFSVSIQIGKIQQKRANRRR